MAEPGYSRLRLVLVATTVGVVSGQLTNSRGFLLARLYLAVLRMRITAAFATSLLVTGWC